MGTIKNCRLEFRRFDSGGRHFFKTESEDGIMKKIVRKIIIVATIAALSTIVARAYMIQTAAPSVPCDIEWGGQIYSYQ